jgi:hypothetical protein
MLDWGILPSVLSCRSCANFFSPEKLPGAPVELEVPVAFGVAAAGAFDPGADAELAGFAGFGVDLSAAS